MSEILVGIDFSKGSLNALNFAVKMANDLDVSVMMLWIDKPHSSDNVFNDSSNYREEVHNRFAELIKEYSSRIPIEKLQYKIRSGKVYDEIASFAKINNSLCIVTGTHGISGYEELWIGSNANRIVSMAPCPVITIRQDYHVPEKIKKIVLPVDSTPETLEKAELAIKIAKAAKAKIILLRLYTSNVSVFKRKVNQYSDLIVEDMEKAGVDYELTEKLTTNLTADLLGFNDKVGADLLIIMTEQESSMASIMLGPYAQQMVNNSPIPVLSVHVGDKWE
jgi:nucleotide-binding universal stress UspA family protein